MDSIHALTENACGPLLLPCSQSWCGEGGVTYAIQGHIVFPNLCHFWFQGVSTYVEAVVHQITAPHLQKLQMLFFEQLTFSIPHLIQFINSTENLRFSKAKLQFSDKHVDVEVYPCEEAETEMYAFHIHWWAGEQALGGTIPTTLWVGLQV